MSNIRVDVGSTIRDGTAVAFRSPVDCSQITGLIVYYPDMDGNETATEFAFADAHGNNVGDIDHLFAENVVVKVILDVTHAMAFVQNADTNAYLEGRFAELAKGTNAFVGIAGEVTYSQFSEAVNAGKACFMYYQNKLYTMSGYGSGPSSGRSFVFYAHNPLTGELERASLNRSGAVSHSIIEGESGSNIDADWIATKELTGGDVVHIPEQTVTSLGWNNLQYDIQPGFEYDVTINGVVYSCIASNSDGGIILGNNTFLTLNDYPFCVFLAGGGATGGMFFKNSNVISSPVTLKVTDHAEYVYNKLPLGYIPDEVALKTDIPNGGNVELDTSLTKSGKAADAKAVGDKFTNLDATIADILKRLGILESTNKNPIYNLPVLRFVGDTTGMTKDTEVVLTCEFVDVYGEPFFTDKVAEVKWQGSSSIWYSKKNYSIKMYENDGETKFKYKAFDDVSANNGYHIKANFIDAWHCRNIVTVNLAKDMYVKKLPSDARGVIDGFPIIVEINGEKQGLYTWNLKQHKSVYGLDEDNANHLMYRAGTNGADTCNFRALSTNNAADITTDWEDRFPETNTAENRAKLNRLISFVKDSDDETFKANFSQYLDLDYTIDYWILCYFGGFTDSLAKNMNIVTYDGNVWYPTFYDCDTTWGINWSGSEQTPYNVRCPEEYQAPNCLLWERLAANFPEEIYNRYFALRDTYLKVDEVVSRMRAFIDSIPAEEYAEDRKIWTLPAASIASGIEYMTAWITNRAAYVDGKMNELIDASVALDGISIEQTLNVTKGKTVQLKVTYTPTNATNLKVAWDSSDDTIATVDENGLVTAVGVGNCIITCTSEDGGHTAECYLNVGEAQVISDGMLYNFDLRQTVGSKNSWASSVNSYTLSPSKYGADSMTDDGYVMKKDETWSLNAALGSSVDVNNVGLTLEATLLLGDGNTAFPRKIWSAGNNFAISPGQSGGFWMYKADDTYAGGSKSGSLKQVLNNASIIVAPSEMLEVGGFAHIVLRLAPGGIVSAFMTGCKFVDNWLDVTFDEFDHYDPYIAAGVISGANPYIADGFTLMTYRAYNRPLTDEEILNNYYVERAK